jgi:hypothetical protein
MNYNLAVDTIFVTDGDPMATDEGKSIVTNGAPYNHIVAIGHHFNGDNE